MTFNWVDALLIVLFLKGIFAKKRELLPEILDLIAVFSAIVITLHYFVRLGNIFKENVIAAAQIGYFISYCLIAVCVLLVFQLIREGWLIVLKIKVHPIVEKWGAIGASLLKSYLLCVLIFFSFVISNNDFAAKGAATSISNIIFRNIAVKIYKTSYLGFISKIFPDEEVNKAIVKIEKKKNSEVE